jgi:hypothetical protein
VNRLPRLNLQPDHIPAGYLAEVAYEWDTWGESTPPEFIEAFSAEVRDYDIGRSLQLLRKVA